jgi:hypothetical protein
MTGEGLPLSGSGSAPLIDLFARQPGDVSAAARRTLPSVFTAAERAGMGRRWVREHMKNHDLFELRPARIAPTAADGVELTICARMSAISRTFAATPAGWLTITIQTSPIDRGMPARADLRLLAANLVRRGCPLVPVRQTNITHVQSSEVANAR